MACVGTFFKTVYLILLILSNGSQQMKYKSPYLYWIMRGRIQIVQKWFNLHILFVFFIVNMKPPRPCTLAFGLAIWKREKWQNAEVISNLWGKMWKLFNKFVHAICTCKLSQPYSVVTNHFLCIISLSSFGLFSFF